MTAGRTFYYVSGLNGQMLTEWDNTVGSATVKDTSTPARGPSRL
ncbi:MAG TPA: hypothetical protein VFO58_16885 [Vicinamibacterales bacterium]|nr:hypothetical protein [Vicinamibacterales bacterium]